MKKIMLFFVFSLPVISQAETMEQWWVEDVDNNIKVVDCRYTKEFGPQAGMTFFYEERDSRCKVHNWESNTQELQQRLDDFNSNNPDKEATKVAEGTERRKGYITFCHMDYRFVEVNNIGFPSSENCETRYNSWHDRVAWWLVKITEKDEEDVAYPYDIPDDQQPGGNKPNPVYYDTEPFDQRINNQITIDLDSNVLSEPASNRYKEQLQIGEFQFKRASCDENNTSSCYRTSSDGARKKVGVQ